MSNIFKLFDLIYFVRPVIDIDEQYEDYKKKKIKNSKNQNLSSVSSSSSLSWNNEGSGSYWNFLSNSFDFESKSVVFNLAIFS